jgi:hypothetical protein
LLFLFFLFFWLAKLPQHVSVSREGNNSTLADIIFWFVTRYQKANSYVLQARAFDSEKNHDEAEHKKSDGNSRAALTFATLVSFINLEREKRAKEILLFPRFPK